MSVEPWYAQPDRPLGTAIVLPGRMYGLGNPLLHWPSRLLTQQGWSVLGVSWDEDAVTSDPVSHVSQSAAVALEQVVRDQPVLVVAKSLGTLALPWAVEQRLPGVWLTPLLSEGAVMAAVGDAQPPTLLVGGTADPLWRRPVATGPGVTVVELSDADHGLERPGDWRGSLLGQVDFFDQIDQLARELLH